MLSDTQARNAKPKEKPYKLTDGHSIDIDGVLIHSEIERRAYNESPIHTSEKIDKAIEYIQGRHYQAEGYSSSLVFFVSTSGSRTSTLMEYVNKKTNGKCSFIGFATTQDWAHAPHMPPPEIPLTPEFQRVGYPPLTLNNLKGEPHV